MMEPLGFDSVLDEALTLTADERRSLMTVLSASLRSSSDVADAVLARRPYGRIPIEDHATTPTFDLIKQFENERRSAAKRPSIFQANDLPPISIIVVIALILLTWILSAFVYTQVGHDRAVREISQYDRAWRAGHPYFDNPSGLSD